MRFGFDDYNNENGLWGKSYDITREETVTLQLLMRIHLQVISLVAMQRGTENIVSSTGGND